MRFWKEHETICIYWERARDRKRDRVKDCQEGMSVMYCVALGSLLYVKVSIQTRPFFSLSLKFSVNKHVPSSVIPKFISNVKRTGIHLNESAKLKENKRKNKYVRSEGTMTWCVKVLPSFSATKSFKRLSYLVFQPFPIMNLIDQHTKRHIYIY